MNKFSVTLINYGITADQLLNRIIVSKATFKGFNYRQLRPAIRGHNCYDNLRAFNVN